MAPSSQASFLDSRVRNETQSVEWGQQATATRVGVNNSPHEQQMSDHLGTQDMRHRPPPHNAARMCLRVLERACRESMSQSTTTLTFFSCDSGQSSRLMKQQHTTRHAYTCTTRTAAILSSHATHECGLAEQRDLLAMLQLTSRESQWFSGGRGAFQPDFDTLRLPCVAGSDPLGISGYRQQRDALHQNVVPELNWDHGARVISTVTRDLAAAEQDRRCQRLSPTLGGCSLWRSPYPDPTCRPVLREFVDPLPSPSHCARPRLLRIATLASSLAHAQQRRATLRHAGLLFNADTWIEVWEMRPKFARVNEVMEEEEERQELAKQEFEWFELFFDLIFVACVSPPIHAPLPLPPSPIPHLSTSTSALTHFHHCHAALLRRLTWVSSLPDHLQKENMCSWQSSVSASHPLCFSLRQA
jgi:hypothetical protein